MAFYKYLRNNIYHIKRIKYKYKKGIIMKSYLHGMLTGGLIVFSFMFLMGNKKKSKKTISKTTQGKFIEIEDRLGMLEGSVNDRFKMVGENFIYLKDKFSISVNTDFDFKSTSLIQNPFPYKINK